MFVTKKKYNEMKDYYDEMIDKYIERLASLEADVDTLRQGIVHAMCYLYDYETGKAVEQKGPRRRTAPKHPRSKSEMYAKYGVKQISGDCEEFE